MRRKIRKVVCAYQNYCYLCHMENNSKTSGQLIAKAILQQLGGNKFIVMTGSKNFLVADKSETVKNVWLRMDLTKNMSGANRLKITYDEASDLYNVHFYNQKIIMGGVKISKETKMEGIYCDQLQSIFTEVTGLYTSLGTMGR